MARENPLVTMEERQALIEQYGVERGRIEARRLYDRRYGPIKRQKRREEYRREYSSERARVRTKRPSRPKIYTSSQFMQAPTEKSLKMLERILRRDAGLVI